MEDGTYLNEVLLNNKKTIFISTLPPPFHGASMSSAMCLEILKNEKSIEVINIKLNYSIDMNDLGKVTFKKLQGIFITSKRIRRLIKIFNPDIIYFAPAVTGFGLLRDFLFLKLIKIWHKGKLILHLRGQFKKKEVNNPLSKFVINSLLVCDKAIVLGPELVKNLNNRIPIEDIYILPNAIVKTLSDLEFQNIIDRKNSGSKINLLFLSNMVEFKGWFKVLETCKLLGEANISFICNFVGEWPSKFEELKFYNYVKTNSLGNNVIYHGQLLSKAKNLLFERSDILVFPTEYDACPRVIIEAMEFGLPVISTNVGTIPSLTKHGETGFILKENTPNEIFKYILILLDKNKRNIMGLKGREEFLAKYTLDIYRNKFISIFNQN
jgi:glycosyltransferase involved in cell wall biosynthesis